MKLEITNHLFLLTIIAVLLTVVFSLAWWVYSQQKQARRHQLSRNRQENYRQELMDALFRAQEDERRRLAQLLHDDIGTTLSVAKMTLNQLERNLDSCSAERSQAQKIRQLLEETLSSVRQISRELVPSTLDRFGLLAALEELARNASNDFFSVHLDWSEKIEKTNPALEVVLYRIVQELVSNAIRHAGATQVFIQCFTHGGELRLAVLDDGHGFDLDEVIHRGLGLRNIESRLSLVNGHVTFDVAPGRGAHIVVQVPLESTKLVTALNARVDA